MDIQRIVYISELVAESSEQKQSLVARIAEESSFRNETCGVTGSLALVDGSVIQILEGPLQSVESTFERICCDTRHTNLRLLEFCEVAQRQFAQWNMACIYDEEARAPEWRESLSILRSQTNLNATEVIDIIARLLRERD